MFTRRLVGSTTARTLLASSGRRSVATSAKTPAPLFFLRRHPKKLIFSGITTFLAVQEYARARARAEARERFYDACNEFKDKKQDLRRKSRRDLDQIAPTTRLGKIAYAFLEWARQVFRGLQLFIVFLPALLTAVPCLVLAPLFDIDNLDRVEQPLSTKAEEVWLDVLTNCIQQSGAILIKVAQYISHRRDLVGDTIADKFYYLRENVPAHSYAETRKIVKEDFGIDLDAVPGGGSDEEGQQKTPSTPTNHNIHLTEFDKTPVASGSIAQVYRGRLADDNTNEVAIKVRHPNVEKQVDTDLKLVHSVCSFLSRFSYFEWMELPVTMDEFRKVLLDQTDLRIEAKNLKVFRDHFGITKQVDSRGGTDDETKELVSAATIVPDVEQFVTFPEPIAATERVLIETFVDDAKPISYFIENPSSLNEEIARLGMQTINRMIWLHNFVHADCHSGNLFFRIKDRRKELQKQRNVLLRTASQKYNADRAAGSEDRAAGGQHTAVPGMRPAPGGQNAEMSPGSSTGTASTSPTSTYFQLFTSLASNAAEAISLELTDLAQSAVEKAFLFYDENFVKDVPPSDQILSAASRLQSKMKTQSSSSTSKHHQLPIVEPPEKRSLRFFRKKEHRHLDIQMVIFDVGMVTVLSEKDRRKFMKLVKSIITRDSNGCAEMLRGLCSYREQTSAKMRECTKDMLVFFDELNKLPLHKVNVGAALRETLNIIATHRLQVEGHFATLLSSLIILEGMAKDLDPQINIMASTVPFLMNRAVETFMEDG
ncbi:unnamed protein product [Amoebophrya sp. A120]|nr:unnamed protein product [Amoebophrya sp. A120]|eukprot:GSA120T00022525001.1